MDNEQLIRALLKDHRPVSRMALPLRLSSSTLAGLVIAIGVSAFGLGVRPDIGAALTTFPFWMKWVYVAMLGLGALLGIHKIARPDAQEQPWLWLLALPVAGMAALAGFQAWRAPPGAWPMLWMGISWNSCPMTIAALSIPVFIALIFAFRRFAPTRLRLAGFLAGLASGGLSAFAYALHCPETSAVFVAIWYSAGVAIPAVIGTFFGPRLLRW
jgi:hypothetical protein